MWDAKVGTLDLENSSNVLKLSFMWVFFIVYLFYCISGHLVGLLVIHIFHNKPNSPLLIVVKS